MYKVIPALRIDLDADTIDDEVSITTDALGSLRLRVSFSSAGVFEFPPQSLPGVPDPLGVGTALARSADFDGDGAPDLLALLAGQAVYLTSVPISGVPPSLVPDFTIDGATQAFFTTGDFDVDGYADVEVVREDGAWEVLYGSSAGLGGPAGGAPRGPDFDANGFEDLGGAATNVVQGIPGRLIVHDAASVLAIGNADTGERPVGWGMGLGWGNLDGVPGDELVVGAPGEYVEVLATDPTSGVMTNRAFAAPAGSFMGVSVAVGDFDADGRDDLALGASSDFELGGTTHVDGAMLIVRGAPDLMDDPGSWAPTGGTIDPGIFPITGTEREICPVGSGTDCVTLRGAAFGFASVTGDFDCDGYEDLAVGAPSATVGATLVAGAVGVVYGSASGLDPAHRQSFTRASVIFGETPLEGDAFGQELAAGNFDGDSFQGRPCIDLAIASADLDDNAGAVHVLYGGPAGLVDQPVVVNEVTVVRASVFRLGQGGLPAAVSPGPLGSLFGSSLAITRADGDRFDDLVVGAPGDDDARGAVYVLQGSSEGAVTAGHTKWTRGAAAAGSGGLLTGGDWYGVSVGATASGVLMGGTFADVTPLSGGAAVTDAGLVHVFDVTTTTPLQLGGRAFDFTEESGTSTLGVWTLRENARHGISLLRPRPAFVRARARPGRFDLSPFAVSDSGVLLPRGAPDCSSATAEPATLWPPLFQLSPVGVRAQHPAGLPVSVEVLSVRQDERRGLLPDARISGDGSLRLRAERRFYLDGRVYHVGYRATASNGASCEGEVLVCVPVHAGGSCADGGPRWESTR